MQMPPMGGAGMGMPPGMDPSMMMPPPKRKKRSKRGKSKKHGRTTRTRR